MHGHNQAFGGDGYSSFETDLRFCYRGFEVEEGRERLRKGKKERREDNDTGIRLEKPPCIGNARE